METWRSQVSYEQEYQKLRDIAALLEEGELPLDELISLLGEATAAFEKCKSQLSAAQRALENLEAAGSGIEHG